MPARVNEQEPSKYEARPVQILPAGPFAQIQHKHTHAGHTYPALEERSNKRPTSSGCAGVGYTGTSEGDAPQCLPRPLEAFGKLCA